MFSSALTWQPICSLNDRVNATKILSADMDWPVSAEQLLKQSLLYREFQAEHEEVLRHKWYESEKRGHDIGFELAQIDWRIKHGFRWRKEWRHKLLPSVFEV
jgi:hypothetical protein